MGAMGDAQGERLWNSTHACSRFLDLGRQWVEWKQSNLWR